MTIPRIEDVMAWEAFDSRGHPTVGCAVSVSGGGQGRVIVPAGASTSSHEAVERRDGGSRYGGLGVQAAVEAIEATLRPAVLGLDAREQERLDEVLEASDDDRAFGHIGANAVLGVSLAAMLAGADGQRRPLWKVLASAEAAPGAEGPLLPLPMVNIVSGGAHAAGAIDVQDVLAVPVGAASFAEAMQWVWMVRRAAAELLEAGGGSSSLVADEGGLAGRLGSNEAALALVTEAITGAGLAPGKDVALAVDVAASQLWTGSAYRLACEDRELTREEWLAVLGQWCERYPVVSLEDVLHEDDWEGWQTSGLDEGRQLLGDDLFATDEQRLRRGIRSKAANAVLVKVNQAGTVTRARRVTELAQTAGYATVVSARSGDTEDFWLADLAVGWEAGQIKVGSLTRSERTSKWNRLLEIERRAGPSARFAGAPVLAGSR